MLSSHLNLSSSSSSSSAIALLPRAFSLSTSPNAPAAKLSLPFPISRAVASPWISVRYSPPRSTFLRVRVMAELVQDKESTESVAAAAAAASGSGNENEKLNAEAKQHSRIFVDVRSEEELLSVIAKEKDEGRLPPNVAAGMEELFHNYKNAVFQSGIPHPDEIVLSNMSVALDRIFLDVEDPFIFPPYHKAAREPFDYYMFGQNYIRPLIDFRNSYVGNIPIFDEIREKLQEGHNVVLISNHQTEADPAVIALLLEGTHSLIAENMTYVAGDRVVTDPLCKPFSLGRNLICVYSKKHMFDVPELVEMKRRSNTRSLKEMALLLRGGSHLLWIAPSGGRDRPNPLTGEWYPAPFDSAVVDNMRRLVEHSGVPGHLYPLALLCYDIMPPPRQVEKEIGERRVITFHGVGLSVGPEIKLNEVTSTCNDSEEAKEAYARALYESITAQYNILKSAIHDKKGLEASTAEVSFSQPWNDEN
ncbi:glycerol-3-phosphate acyltransferase ATS12, chloroplastic [Rhodamnia argentea]|uniref:glycerol-3-phosphate 1-O-acyltransferase n=1 Tax=Rhodamnia argentea TaxID=178133 RepID=A0A8B8PFY1_9MYRT|nr:glycerol-3-phosphate acyltransferase ATS12, chloroplastic [Rhodamnia argentea]